MKHDKTYTALRKALSMTILLMTIALCTNCSDQHNAVIPTDGTATIDFVINNYRQYDLDSPTDDANPAGAPAVVTRSTDVAVDLDHLAFAIYDNSQQLVHFIEQDKADANYNSFSATLPYGSYTFVFVGYNGSNSIDMQQVTHLSFENDYVPNCFLKSMTITVNESTPAQQNVVMDRAVGCFTTSCTKGIPQNMEAMTYEATGGGKALNALTGFASQTESLRTHLCQQLYGPQQEAEL